MNPSTALATVLVDELVRGGVREAVLCPGSRSAPLAYALAEADAAGRLRLHVRVDERSAGFLALGLARGGGRPAVVVTTSGTAVANLHPAVLEAHHAAVPLVVLSADRPAELRGTGANQTTRQPGLFGPAVRWEHDLPAPEVVSATAAAAWRSTVCRVLDAATGPVAGWGGPVHLNVALRDPLAPDLDGHEAKGAGGAEGTDEAMAGRADGAPWTQRCPGGRDALAVRDETGPGPGLRTLVLLGDLPDPELTRAALAWAGEAGWPLLAEPFGVLPVGPTVVPHAPLVAARVAAGRLPELVPDRVLVVGRLTLFREFGALGRDPRVVVEQVATGPSWTDPGHVVRRVHGPEVLATAPVRVDGAEDWVAAWVDAGRRLDALVAGGAGTDEGPDVLAGPRVAAAVVDPLTEEDLLVLGSSNAPRLLAQALTGRERPVRVVASRGLAGIDGMVSTAAGAALGSGRRSVALLGDLTFLHDVNGLLIGPDEPRPDLTVVVVNDDGGGIFSTLEYGEPARSDSPSAAATTERIFGTPHGTDLAALCAAHHVPHRRVTTLTALADALAEGRAVGGLRVVEVPLDRSTHRPLRDRLLG